ncbi:uncharacterized protein DSM5745_05799 [Aspergillus mulundensis]|uniref:Rhodopsin domain-containing protein n=1 Tax=Aspergillus mulundensis TaxID=1810919 RepID=A0A3D8RY09_9EURO|nr:Uncharacterized protein DSM5745_05799 [Aspergillus mulundensis]RDW78947.1 Uncharacterized protein DSM5745_05799 [Aspergillus mulundensis]
MATITTDVDFTQNRQAEVHVVGWVFTGIAIATVGLKVTARHLVHRLGWDDFFIFFSLALSIIAAALVSYSVTLGLGRHTAAVIAEHGIERVSLTSRWQILGYPFNIGSFSFPNISIAILINNLLDPNPLRSRLLLGMSIMQVVFAMVSIFLIFLQCRPTSALWDHTIDATCWDERIFYDFSYWVSAYTTMTDIILAIVPIRVFWKLKMRRSTKVGVCVMMGLTLLSAIVTIVKATYLPLFTDRLDPLYNVTPLVIWGLIEQNVVIVAACIPTLRPFFKRAFESRASSHRSRSKSSSFGSGFKLSSTPRAKRYLTDTELLQETQVETVTHRDAGLVVGLGFDVEAGSQRSHSSQLGIWQTREVIVESDEEEEGKRAREMKSVVAPNLR